MGNGRWVILQSEKRLEIATGNKAGEKEGGRTMDATIHQGDEVGSRIGKIVGDGPYVRAQGMSLPEDFIIYHVDSSGRKHGVKPVSDYREGRDLVRALNSKEEK